MSDADYTYIDPLTNRELDVLQLLAEGLSNQEIADRLVVEISTVKWYNRQIYSKLQVKNRKQAVIRARTIGILTVDDDDPLHAPLHNLPADTIPFIGREREINELVGQLQSETVRFITIRGPGGMGKTRLSIEVGRHLLTYFRDGVYFISLAAVTSLQQILTTIADAIRFKFHSEIQPEQQLLTHLKNLHLLLIVDNFEHLVAHASLLSTILKAAPHVKLLVTSREKLALGGESLYVIGGLSLTPNEEEGAVKLFMEASKRNQTQTTKDDNLVVESICHMLGGLPLAILLAAAWLDTLSLNEIEAEIQSGFDILEGNLRDAPERHQSIESVFDYSWNRLTAQEQAIFTRLSIFRGGFTREAAKAVAGASIRDLQHLVHTSFIQHFPTGRYAIHELMRQYGELKLQQSGEFMLTQSNHATYFADFIEPVGYMSLHNAEPQYLRAINSDFENLRAAWQFWVSQKKITELRRIADGLWVFFDSYSRSREAIDLFEPVLDIFSGEQKEHRHFRGKILALLAWFYADIGLRAYGVELNEIAIDLMHDSDSIGDILVAKVGMGIGLGNIAKHDESYAMHSNNYALARDKGVSHWQPLCAYLLAWMHIINDDLQDALVLVDEMVPSERHMITGVVLNLKGDCERAEEELIKCQALRGHHRFGNMIAYSWLSMNAVKSKHYQKAWHYLQQGLQYTDNDAYAWLALFLLGDALTLFSSEKMFEKLVEIISLIRHHPAATPATRNWVSDHADALQTDLSEEDFQAAWERGKQLDLGDVISELMER